MFLLKVLMIVFKRSHDQIRRSGEPDLARGPWVVHLWSMVEIKSCLHPAGERSPPKVATGGRVPGRGGGTGVLLQRQVRLRDLQLQQVWVHWEDVSSAGNRRQGSPSGPDDHTASDGLRDQNQARTWPGGQRRKEGCENEPSEALSFWLKLLFFSLFVGVRK